MGTIIGASPNWSASSFSNLVVISSHVRVVLTDFVINKTSMHNTWCSNASLYNDNPLLGAGCSALVGRSHEDIGFGIQDTVLKDFQ